MLHKPITLNFIVTSCINYCNDSNVIAMIFLLQLAFFLVVEGCLSCLEIINMALISWEPWTTYVQVQVKAFTSSEPPIKCYLRTITRGTSLLAMMGACTQEQSLSY